MGSVVPELTEIGIRVAESGGKSLIVVMVARNEGFDSMMLNGIDVTREGFPSMMLNGIDVTPEGVAPMTGEPGGLMRKFWLTMEAKPAVVRRIT